MQEGTRTMDEIRKSLLLELEVLAESSKEDYAASRWSNYDAYVIKYNEILRMLKRLGSYKELAVIENVPDDEAGFWEKGTPAEQEKLKEVSLDSEQLLSRLRLELQEIEQDEGNRLNDKKLAFAFDKRKQDDGYHWYVDGEDRGPVARNEKTIIYIIAEILSNHTDDEWIPHGIFIEKAPWSKEEYMGDKGRQGRMEKYLWHVRKKLDLDIQFDKEKGVRFRHKPVKSKLHPK
jgi:hypothetical protein